jgi:D-alanine-D-alanine ligase
MKFKNYYIIANTREQFANESKQSQKPYSDHPSSESIDFVAGELCKAGFPTIFYGGVEHLIQAYEKKLCFKDTLFLNFSDGLSQNSRKAQTAILLELLEVPYAGSDPLARLMAGNKSYSKKIVAEQLTTPQGVTIFRNMPIPNNVMFPVIIKPNREGSSIGISQESFCTSMHQLQKTLPGLLERFDEVLIEEYIEGYEITCFIIGNKDDYLLTEPIACEYDGVRYFKDFVFGLEEKANRKRIEFPAREILNNTEIETICNSARIAFEILNMHDFARVDFRLNQNGDLYFIELNGNAVISKTSELGVVSKALGIPFGKLVGDIILSAEKRLRFTHG